VSNDTEKKSSYNESAVGAAGNYRGDSEGKRGRGWGSKSHKPKNHSGEMLRKGSIALQSCIADKTGGKPLGEGA